MNKKYFTALVISSGFLCNNAIANPTLNNAQIGIINKSLFDDFTQIVETTIKLTEIPAPPFGEMTRAKAFKEMLEKSGLSNVEMDAEGNVMGLRLGKRHDKILVVAAHLDTVFPIDTNVKVRIEDNRLYAPGIGDDTVSLSIMLSMIKAMDLAKISTNYDILFVGDVGEEGQGNLRGTRYLFQKGKYKDKIKFFLSLEPGVGGGYVDRGIGSKRYKVEFSGPGGHSFGDFGIVSPAYAMSDAIVRFAKYKANSPEKTTFNVGVLEGGTSVNSIPHSVAMTIDMRSSSAQELAKIDEYFLAQLEAATENENQIRAINRGKISYKTTIIGERAVGKTPADSIIQKTAIAVYEKFGLSTNTSSGSTDSNVPMSMGIEALTIGSGIDSDGAHSLNEFIILDRPKNIKTIIANIALINALANQK